MGKGFYDAYPAAKAVFDEVDEALGEKLSALIFQGPEETLRLTANAQPALMAVSLGAWRALQAEGVSAEDGVLFAGHSLGEYSALAAADALSVGQTAKLLRLRGEAMQAAVPAGEGAMAALLGLEPEVAEAVAAQAAGDQVCELANDNAPGQSVVSGDAAAVERAVEIAKGKGAKRAVMLPVSAPFHCQLMAPAAEAMAAALSEATINAPKKPVLANVSVTLLDEPDAIRDSLVAQVTGRVRWRESMVAAAGMGVTHLAEIGAGKVLSGLAKRIDRSLNAVAVNEPGDCAALTAILGKSAHV